MGMVAYIHKEEDEKRPLAKNQPVSKSKLVGRFKPILEVFVWSNRSMVHISSPPICANRLIIGKCTFLSCYFVIYQI